MKTTRYARAKLNSASTLLNQLVSTACGIIIPRLMLGAFGSVLYGATTSISKFLSYITLLESGVGRVARAELYKPLAERDQERISSVYYAIVRFFRIVAIVFILYTVLLAFAFFDVSRITGVTRKYVFFLVLAISLSTVIDYLCGISNQTLLNADQRKYVTNAVIIVTRVLNTLLVLVLIHLGSGMILVKLGSSLIIILRPLFLSWYVKRHYKLPRQNRKQAALAQKWTGMAQHLAYFIHTNTDVALLTVFSNLSLVAVYAVYSLVTTSIKNLIFSLAGGMEAELGDMYAKKEHGELSSAYQRYQAIISMACVTLFGVTGLLILPFVRIYTRGITDADYIRPLFAFALILGEAGDCLAMPCSTLPVSCNHLRKTQWGSFGEAIINVGLSLALIFWDPLLGVALGTVAAELFKLGFYTVYACRTIRLLSLGKELLRLAVTGLAVCGFCLLGLLWTDRLVIGSYLIWALYALAAFILCAAVAVLLCELLYRPQFKAVMERLLRRRKAG